MPSGKKFLIDPWLINPVFEKGKQELAALRDVDLILLTHGHGDHVGESVEIAEKTGAAVIPPFDHEHIIAGAGTAALEIVDEWPEVASVITPLGGGGLLSGTSLGADGRDVYGVEPEAGNDGERSFHSGSIVTIDPPKTIADGARTLAIGQRNFAIIRQRVRDVVSVNDEILLETLKWAMYRTKLVIEPTGALGLAALFAGKIRPKGPVAVVISGGNLDFGLLGG